MKPGGSLTPPRGSYGKSKEGLLSCWGGLRGHDRGSGSGEGGTSCYPGEKGGYQAEADQGRVDKLNGMLVVSRVYGFVGSSHLLPHTDVRHYRQIGVL